MGTITDERIIRRIIDNDGRYDPEDPPVVRIVEYENAAGEKVWGVVWANEPLSTHFRYDEPTYYVRNPKVIFAK